MLIREQQIIAENVKSLLDLIPVVSNLERQVNLQPTNLAFFANTTFVTRKSVEILDAVKKKLQELEKLVAEQACIVMAQLEEDKYSTEYCTVSPNSSLYVKYPASPRDEGYEEFVKQLPITAIRPHYPSVVQLIVEAVGRGEQVPFGLDKQKIQGIDPKLRLTPKKEM